MIEKIVRSYAVTPTDDTVLTNGPCDAVLVGVAGNVEVTYKDPINGAGIEDIVYLAAGVWHKMSVSIIHDGSTTADEIHAGYIR